MKYFVSYCSNFEINAFGDGKPVESTKNVSYGKLAVW